MFIGKFEVPLDDRNRIVLPASFRNVLAADGHEASFALYAATRRRVLRLYPLKPGAGLEGVMEQEQLASSPHSAEREEELVDFMSSLYHLEMDKKHRLKIPEECKALAGIQQRAMLLGLSKFIEIWSPDVWEERARARGDSVAPPVAPDV